MKRTLTFIWSFEIRMWLKLVAEHPPAQAEPRSQKCKKRWLSISPRKFGSHVTVCPGVRPYTLWGWYLVDSARVTGIQDMQLPFVLAKDYQGRGNSPRGSQWSFSSVDLEFRLFNLRQKTLKDMFLGCALTSLTFLVTVMLAVKIKILLNIKIPYFSILR